MSSGVHFLIDPTDVISSDNTNANVVDSEKGKPLNGLVEIAAHVSLAGSTIMRLKWLIIAMSVSAYGPAQIHAADAPTKSQLCLTFFETQDVGGCGLAIVI
jgi:hypothetical protein